MAKVLMVISSFPFPASSGDKIATANIINALLNIGFAVDIITFDRAKIATPKHIFTGEIFKVPLPSKIARIALAFFSRNSTIFMRFYSKKLYALLDVIGEKYDYIYYHHLYMAQHLTAKAKSVINLDALESLVLEQRAKYTKNPIAKAILRYEARQCLKAELAILNENELVYCYGEGDLRYLEKMNIRNIRQIPFALDLEFYRLMRERRIEEQKSFVFYGDYAWYPNYDACKYIIHSIIPKIRNIYPEYKILFAGRNASRSLQKAIEMSGGIFLGEVKDIYGLICQCEYIIGITRIGGGVRLKVLEALALGKKVIVTRASAEGIFDKEILFLNEENDIHPFRENDRIMKNQIVAYAEKYHNSINIVREMFGV
jgi:glycosyltransferase involved in cell wall biosynthesis